MKLKKIVYLDVSAMGEMAGVFAWFLRPIKESLEDPETDWRLSDVDRAERDKLCGNVERILAQLEDPNGAIRQSSIVRGVDNLGQVLSVVWVEDVLTHRRPMYSANYLVSIGYNGLEDVAELDAEVLEAGHRLLAEFVSLTKVAATRGKQPYDDRVRELMEELTKLLAGNPELKARVVLVFSSVVLHRVLRVLDLILRKKVDQIYSDLYEIHPYYRALGKLLCFPTTA